MGIDCGVGGGGGWFWSSFEWGGGGGDFGCCGERERGKREERDECFFIWEMLMDALRVMVNNLLKKIFMGKEKKSN